MNKLLKSLQKAKSDGFTEGVWQGIQLGINLTVIAYYNVLGIGKKRYKKVAPELTRMINEIRVDDPIRTEKQIKEAFERMK